MGTIKRILITVPNTSWFGKRLWVVPPYTLAMLGAVTPPHYELNLFDPHLGNLGFEQALAEIEAFGPDLVGITCMSLEYAPTFHRYAAEIRRRLPRAVIVLGGPYATTSTDLAMEDGVADFVVMGEGEERFPQLLAALEEGRTDFSAFDGLAWRRDGVTVVNPIVTYIENLDTVPFPNYAKAQLPRYFESNNAFGNVMNARYEPYAITTTSRGCPYPCIYCSTEAIDGKRIRFRTAENVLAEVDWLVNEFGIKEILFLDDNLIFNKPRFRKILQGLIERNYDLHWKSVNLATFLLTDELLEQMWEAKCYQLILPIESGNQYVLDHVLRKPLKLDRVAGIMKKARELGFETASDFIIGSPGETWDQIRDSFRFAEEMDADMTSFHIATPLPRTQMYEIAREKGYLPEGFNFGSSQFFGFGRGCITTEEFTPRDLHMLRALEWDRINFKTPEKKARFARMAGIGLDELERWRRNTIRNLGIYFPNAEGTDYTAQENADAPREGLLDKNGRFAKVVNG
ncbi:MAG: radical SAM protein [Magnetococcales bacterium]|nr:radical SAM protein [Magnetococcales bacterium]